MADAAQRQQEAKRGLLAAASEHPHHPLCIPHVGSEWPSRPGCKALGPRGRVRRRSARRLAAGRRETVRERLAWVLLACCCYCNPDIILHCTAPSLRARPAIPDPSHLVLSVCRPNHLGHPLAHPRTHTPQASEPDMPACLYSMPAHPPGRESDSYCP